MKNSSIPVHDENLFVYQHDSVSIVRGMLPDCSRVCGAESEGLARNGEQILKFSPELFSKGPPQPDRFIRNRLASYVQLARHTIRGRLSHTK